MVLLKTGLGNNGRDIVSNGETLSTALVRLAGSKVGAAARVEWSGVHHWVEAAWRARPTGTTPPLAHPRKSTTAERGELLEGEDLTLDCRHPLHWFPDVR